MTTNAVVIADTGSTHFGALIHFQGEPLLLHAVRRLQQTHCVDSIVVIASAKQVDKVRAALVDSNTECSVEVIASCDDLLDSLRKATDYFTAESVQDVVLVHDASRALTPSEQIRTVRMKVLEGFSSVLPVLPVTDTIKHVDEHGVLTNAVDRARLREAQTPQGFSAAAFRALVEKKSLQKAMSESSREITTHTIPGHPLGLRIESSVELAAAEAILITNQESGSSS